MRHRRRVQRELQKELQRELWRELHALAVDPAFAAEFIVRLRQCLAQQREEALLEAIFGEAASGESAP